MLRDATPSDATAIAKLHAESWRSVYRGILTEEYLEKHVRIERQAFWQERFSANNSTPPMCVIVAETGNKLAGFACVFPEHDARWGSFLDNLHVAPHLTGQGIGRKLLAETGRRLLARGSRGGLYLWVVEQNHRARKFYEREGARVVESAVNFLPDGQRVSALRCHWDTLTRVTHHREKSEF